MTGPFAAAPGGPPRSPGRKPAPLPVTIVGAGLVGSLLAMVLLRRGTPVQVYERRPDMRLGQAQAGRSINLVATERGLKPLDRVGLRRAVLDLTVEVRGRTMHDREGRLTYHPYGKDAREVNHSVPRGGLNALLMSEAESRGAHIHFHHRLIAADPAAGVLEFQDESRRRTVRVETPGPIIGADGAGSLVRAALDRLPGHGSTFEPLGHSYKELEIPPGPDGHRIDPHSLHIWPRGHCMMMALANRDGSFTVTLYLPDEGEASFATLDTPDGVQRFFAAQFPDSLALIPRLREDFFDHPTGHLGTVRAQPWNVEGRVTLIGDAAHAVVPFFGQGMNCGFEDCAVLDDLLNAHDDDWDAALPEYSRKRKVAADAIADLALENFVEMRDRVGDPAFLLRKQVEHRLEQALPQEFRSRYAMVVYSAIPYDQVRALGRLQDGILDTLCAGLTRAEDVDLAHARRLIQQRLAAFRTQHGITLDF